MATHGVIRCTRDLPAMSMMDLGLTCWDNIGLSLAWATHPPTIASRQLSAFASTTQATLAQIVTAYCASLKQQCHTLSLGGLHHSSGQPCPTISAGSLSDALMQAFLIIITSVALSSALSMAINQICRERESVLRALVESSLSLLSQKTEATPSRRKLKY